MSGRAWPAAAAPTSRSQERAEPLTGTESSRDAPAADAQTAGLTPIRVHVDRPAGGLAVSWIDLRGLAFDRPFFQDTLDLALADPARRRTTTPLAALHGAAARRRAEAPRAQPGFVFHMARCGSTLVSRSLAQAEAARVLGEPNPLTDLVELLPRLPAEARPALLRDLVDLLAPPAGRPFVIKAMSALTCRLPLFLETFPGLRWAFVYRDPVEVLVSLVQRPNFAVSLQAEPQRAAALTGLPPEAVARYSRAEYAIALTRQICARVVEAARGPASGPGGGPGGPAGGQALAVDYVALPGAVTARLAPHFGIEFTAAERAALEALWQRDAKQPERAFVDDRAAKQAAAPAPFRQAVERLLTPLITELRRLPAPAAPQVGTAADR